jgi:2-polyprenyl-6-methoxyphenol hydroxylase-like FAD-dependent oxidoreductase
MHDVIVSGARCAGAPTAMLLARKGYKVLLVDRATFPSDIPHGHFIHRHGPRRLAHWGLLDRIAASNCPPVTSCVMDLGDFPLIGTGISMDGVALGYGPRRSVLDTLLVDAAVEAAPSSAWDLPSTDSSRRGTASPAFAAARGAEARH